MKMKPRSLLAASIYPSVLILAVILHRVLLGAGLPLLASTYIPVLSAALLIQVLEFALPYQKEWLPNKSDVGNDLMFMAALQLVLPKALGFLVVSYLLSSFQSLGWGAELWPHELSPFLQAGIMMLSAEFFRYWLHRAFHEVYFLWPFHAVHHSPHKLYWLNVNRFHPIDKATQYIFDAMPFLLLGVSEEVLALYFVFYAVNGFFQHCNVDVRLGVLNYLVSGPELHRWHHSIFPEESNQNYGNNLIVWDLVFGSYFLPKDRSVGDLGLINRQYPLSFMKQMGTPFVSNLDKRVSAE
jgi:sterol desaturase/sphingolipid hydroxylase (fatty acid hydroxylase superfamily)